MFGVPTLQAGTRGLGVRRNGGLGVQTPEVGYAEGIWMNRQTPEAGKRDLDSQQLREA